MFRLQPDISDDMIIKNQRKLISTYQKARKYLKTKRVCKVSALKILSLLATS
jgi:3-methyladenine DNA glycosylase Tag